MAPANSYPAAIMRAGSTQRSRKSNLRRSWPQIPAHESGRPLPPQQPDLAPAVPPNTSDRIRYLFHQVYGQRFVAQRFWPYLNYHMPDYVLEGADERLLRVLGKTPRNGLWIASIHSPHPPHASHLAPICEKTLKLLAFFFCGSQTGRHKALPLHNHLRPSAHQNFLF